MNNTYSMWYDCVLNGSKKKQPIIDKLQTHSPTSLEIKRAKTDYIRNQCLAIAAERTARNIILLNCRFIIYMTDVDA